MTQAILIHRGKYKFELAEPLDYKVTRCQVPKGFITDLASVPRLLWSAMPPYGLYLEAAIIHDHALIHFSRLRAAEIFKERMKFDGVKPWRAWILYASVRAFDWYKGWHRG